MTANATMTQSNHSRDPSPRVIWLMGASTGIGKALAEQYGAEGQTVIISARREDQLNLVKDSILEQYPNAQVMVLPVDMCDEASLTQAYSMIESEFGYLDSIVVNAGTCEYLNSVKIDMGAVRRVMETNFFGALNVVNTGLPLLRSAIHLNRKAPQLVFVSSSVTYQALPRAGAYGGSKAALAYFAETLKLDLQHEGIDVRIVSPGFVKTPLTDQNDFAMPARVSAENAASRIIDGLSSSQFDIHFPKRFTLVLKLIGLLPTGLKHRLLGKMSRHLDDLSAY